MTHSCGRIPGGFVLTQYLGYASQIFLRSEGLQVADRAFFSPTLGIMMLQYMKADLSRKGVCGFLRSVFNILQVVQNPGGACFSVVS